MIDDDTWVYNDGKGGGLIKYYPAEGEKMAVDLPVGTSAFHLRFRTAEVEIGRLTPSAAASGWVNTSPTFLWQQNTFLVSLAMVPQSDVVPLALSPVLRHLREASQAHPPGPWEAGPLVWSDNQLRWPPTLMVSAPSRLIPGQT